MLRFRQEGQRLLARAGSFIKTPPTPSNISRLRITRLLIILVAGITFVMWLFILAFGVRLAYPILKNKKNLLLIITGFLIL